MTRSTFSRLRLSPAITIIRERIVPTSTRDAVVIWTAFGCFLLIFAAALSGPLLIAQGSCTAGAWSTAPATLPILGIHAHLLPNGKVLAWTHDDTIPGRAYI